MQCFQKPSYLHFSAIKNHKILSNLPTLPQSGRHLLQHHWRPHSNALHQKNEAPQQTAQLLLPFCLGISACGWTFCAKMANFSAKCRLQTPIAESIRGLSAR
jgi:hypothetical protein